MNQNKLDTFLNHIKSQDFQSAAQILSSYNQQEIVIALQAMHEAIQFKVHSISILKRELNPNTSYDDFHQAWLPPIDKKDVTITSTGVSVHYFPFPVRVINAVNIKNDKEIISIGLMGATKQDIENLQSSSTDQYKKTLRTETARHDQIEKVSTKVGNTDFFECKDDNNLG
ncbi:MAG: hypothetical protein NTZ68_01720 [Candidatus Dependentiae bacterium]|nr:hypothetical protein [Candidatus Dependentiae bacterium]